MARKVRRQPAREPRNLAKANIITPPRDGGFGPLTSGFGAVADHQRGPLVRQIEISDTPEPGALERPNGSHIRDVGFGDHPSGARIRVQLPGGDRTQQVNAQAPPAALGGTGEQVHTGVALARGLVPGQRVKICAIKLPVAHRDAVQLAHTRWSAR